MRSSKRIFVVLAFGILLTAIQQCKPDPPVSKNTATDPDSLYVGRPYTITVPSGSGFHYRNVTSPAGNPLTYEGIALGRMLFYDTTLSSTKHLACGKCHQQQFSFGDNTPKSINVSGPTKRNTSALVNLGMSKTFFWDGRQASIEDAAKDALEHEQNPTFTSLIQYLDTTPAYKYLFKKAFGRPGDITEDKIVKAIAQFIRTMVSVNSKYDMLLRGEIGAMADNEMRGRAIFLSQDSGDCTHCHADGDGTYTTFAFQPNPFRNNALDSVATVTDFADFGLGKTTGLLTDYGKFKIATLRNVEVSAPYMHDGRFTTLDQIADHYGTKDSLKNSPTTDPLMERFVKPIPDLDSRQKADLVAFLKTFTDTAFLHNPALANPFH